MLQRRTDILIQPQHVLVVTQTLTVRRIHDHQRFLRLLIMQLLNTHLLDVYIRPQVRRLDILQRRLNRIKTCIRTVDTMLKLPLGTVVVVYRLQQLCIEIRPPLKPELLPEYPRRYVQRNQSRLYQQRARTAHRVIQITLPVPARQQQHTCRQGLVQRRLRIRYPVSALMQRLTRTVQRYRHLVMTYMQVNPYIRIIRPHIRTLARRLIPVIHDRILHTIRDKQTVMKQLTIHRRIHRKSLIHPHVLTPIDPFNDIVYLILRLARLSFHF